jgi:hypothetical protein
MAASPRSYRTIEEFEREEIRPSFRIGFSVDDLEEGSFEAELNFELDRDPAEMAGDGDDAYDDDEDEDEADDAGQDQDS